MPRIKIVSRWSSCSGCQAGEIHRTRTLTLSTSPDPGVSKQYDHCSATNPYKKSTASAFSEGQAPQVRRWKQTDFCCREAAASEEEKGALDAVGSKLTSLRENLGKLCASGGHQCQQPMHLLELAVERKPLINWGEPALFSDWQTKSSTRHP